MLIDFNTIKLNFIKKIYYNKKSNIKSKKAFLDQDLSIISNDCFGALLLKKYNIKFNTPFVNLFLFPHDYIGLLENFANYIEKKIIFIKYYESKFFMKEFLWDYPIAIFENTNIEIHFLHYGSEAEALKKWEERKKRITKNIIFVLNDRKGMDNNLLKKFQNINIERKFFITSRKAWKNQENITYIPIYSSFGYIHWNSHLCIENWLDINKLNKKEKYE